MDKSSVDEKQLVTIDYTNYRGERGTRRIGPGRIHFAAANWHPEPQWLLDAFDLDREAERSFAMKDIHAWRAGGESE